MDDRKRRVSLFQHVLSWDTFQNHIVHNTVFDAGFEEGELYRKNLF